MISLIIPATTSNQHYTDFAVQQIRELYPNENEVEIVVLDEADHMLDMGFIIDIKKKDLIVPRIEVSNLVKVRKNV